LIGFVLKKILTSIFLPLGFVIIFLVLSALFTRKRLGVCAVALAALIYVLSINPTAELFMRPLEDAYKPADFAEVSTCDAYVVLGGGINENVPDIDGLGTLSSYALPRVVTAYRLYVRAKKPIIFSGGKIFNRTAEAEIAKRFLISLGVPSHHIITEAKSIDTYENAQYVKEIADRYQLKKIVLITSAAHMKRSYLLFNKRFKEIVPYPTDYRTSRGSYDVLSFLPNTWSLGLVEIAVKEYLGILFYRLTL
jgi:uncharacterized SAM-binding protein YcdF (DUF218 family)